MFWRIIIALLALFGVVVLVSLTLFGVIMLASVKDLANDEKFVRRFQREALSASSLTNENFK